MKPTQRFKNVIRITRIPAPGRNRAFRGREPLIHGCDPAVQAVVVLLAVALLVLTVIGNWFRGEGMTLTWPGAG